MDCLTSPCPNLSTGAVNTYLSLLFNYLTVSQCSLSPPEMWPADYGEYAIRKGFVEKYDFIIVGAGSAGCVLANRLSENPDWKILLLEAGGDPPIEAAIPRLSSTLYRSSSDWGTYAERSDNHSLYTANGIYWSRGKMLGGSSSHNGMVYIRGTPGDYNNWESLGNPTWGYENVLFYFKKSEANKNPEIANAFGGYYHSTDGLMSVERFSTEPIDYTIIGAAQELGFKFVPDINAKEHIGVTLSQCTTKSGLRESTATAFLVPAMNRPNLHVVKHAHVLNLIVDSNSVVTGVRMNLRGQQELEAYATREVILSAGAVNSPQILMLSGIGPAPHLGEMGIPVLQNLQVGKNLQDHPTVPLFFTLDQSTGELTDSREILQEFFQYLTTHTGYFAKTGILRACVYANVHDPFAKYPDFQYGHFIFQKSQLDDLIASFKTVDASARAVPSKIHQSYILNIGISYLTAKSRGEILLRSAEPAEKVRIFTNYLSEYSDILAFIKSIRLYLKFLKTKSFIKHEVELLVIPIPECDALIFDSDEYWACYIRYMVTTNYHPVGTVKMGPDSDPDSVVDHKLRVKGTSGLRVIDASIMPVIPGANTNAPTVMIAEKGADFIKEDNA